MFATLLEPYATFLEDWALATGSGYSTYIKGKSSRKLMQEFRDLSKRYWGQHIWSRGYFAVTVGNLNQQQVQEYIENQETHHKNDNFSVSEH